MHIGLIGGIGPSATVAYYMRLVEKFKDENIPLELTIAHADISILTKNASSRNSNAQAEVFGRHIDELKGAGCDIVLITALTGHFCLEETRRISALPLLDGIELIDGFSRERGIKVLGLLGSPPVLESGLFGLLKSTEVVVPQKDLDHIGTTYMKMATSGVCSEDERQLFFEAGSEMSRHQSADAILLAGTDLGLAFYGFDPGFEVIDALDIHVNELVRLASSQKG